MKYLSSEWIAAANLAVAEIETDSDGASIGYVVSDGESETSYTIVLGPGTVGVSAGVEGAGVVLRLSRELAVAIAKNEASAQRAFLDGHIRVGGDVRVLLGNTEAMKAVDHRLAELRNSTVY